MQGLLPILFMWGIIAFIGKITKLSKEQQKKAAAGRPAQDKPLPGKTASAKPTPAKPASAKAAPAPRPAAPVQPHVSTPLEAHMHEPVMGEEGVGTEGIDCCHEYMLETPAEEAADFLPMTEENSDERARALLQGVIFSEILGRRAPRRLGGRRA